MNINISIFYWINNDLANPFFDIIMPPLSDCGGFVTLIAICIIAILILRYFKKEKYLEIAKLCLYALILSGIVTACIKLAVHEPRPFTVLNHVRQLTVPTEPNSFPSGHTSSTISVISVLVAKLKENRIVVCLLIAFAILVAFSRVYVGVHYPFDVLVGAVIGISSGIIITKIKRE